MTAIELEALQYACVGGGRSVFRRAVLPAHMAIVYCATYRACSAMALDVRLAELEAEPSVAGATSFRAIQAHAEYLLEAASNLVRFLQGGGTGLMQFILKRHMRPVLGALIDRPS